MILCVLIFYLEMCEYSTELFETLGTKSEENFFLGLYIINKNINMPSRFFYLFSLFIVLESHIG